VPFTSLHTRKYGQKTNQNRHTTKTKHNPVKQTTQIAAKQNYPGSVAFYVIMTNCIVKIRSPTVSRKTLSGGGGF